MNDLPMRGKLLVTDLDGTLVMEGGHIPARNIDALARFVRAGGQTAFATGRSAPSAKRFTAQVSPTVPSIVCNGGGIYDFSSDAMLWSVSLPAAYTELVESAKTAFPDVGIEVHSGGSVHFLVKNAQTKEYPDYPALSAVQPPPDGHKVLFCSDNARLLELSDHLEACGRRGCDFVFSSPGCFELLPRNISKGAALKILADELGIAAEDIFSIGDFYNDVELLRESAIAAVPSGAPDDLKALADVVVGPCQIGAVADFVEYLEDRLGV